MNQRGTIGRALTGKAPLTIVDQGIVSAANFFTSIIIGRACSKDEFGLYMLGFSIVILCVNTQVSLISAAYTVYSPRLPGEERARYTGSTLIHQLVLAALAVTGLLIAATVFSLGVGPKGLAPVAWTLAAVIFFLLLKEYARQICFAGLRTKTVLVLDLFVSCAQVIGLLLLAWFGALAANTAYWILGGACALAAFAWLSAMRRHFAPRRQQVLPDFRHNWTFSKWIFAQNLAFVASNQVYPWLLAGFHGPEANGVFGACAGVVFFANPFIIGLGNFLGPKTAHAYSQGGAGEMRRVVSLADQFFLITMTLFCGVMVFFGNWVLVLLFGAKYAGNGTVVSLLALGQLVWAMTVPANFGLNALERPDVAFKSLLLSLVVMATVGVWLVWAFGPMGVAAGLLTGNMAACIYTRLVFAKRIRACGVQCVTL